MNVFRPLALLGLLLATSPTEAGKPGDAKVEEPDKESNAQRLEIFDNNKGETQCKVKGKVCLRAASGTESEGSEAVPVFKRPKGGENSDWIADFFANFKKPSLAGNAQFIFSDVQDSKAAKAREVTALYQATIKGGGSVSARVRFSKEEGFRVGRLYHAQVVQLLGGKEVILAEGDFQLK